jgi:hypothetical protein
METYRRKKHGLPYITVGVFFGIDVHNLSST